MEILFFILSFILFYFCNCTERDEIKHLMNPNDDLLLWPQPINITTGDGSSFNFELLETASNENISLIIDIYRNIIFGKTKQNTGAKIKQSLKIKIDNPDIKELEENTSEEYRLNITKELIILQASTYFGVIRGLETFSQLVYFNVTYSSRDKNAQRNYTYYIPQIPIYISDKPKFSYRGLQLDTSRHFLSLDSIKRTIDGLMYTKLNVLHWHIMDDDTYPLESNVYPDITFNSAYSQFEIYTKEEVKDIIKYAEQRGVRVIVELDQPGHALSLGHSKEVRETIVGWENQLLLLPHGHFDPTLHKTYKIVKNLLVELTQLFKDRYIHLGGDEVYGLIWDSKQSIKETLEKFNISNYNQLQNKYTKIVRNILEDIDKTKKPIYWSNRDTFFMSYKKDDILQWWGSTEDLPIALEKYKEQKFIISSVDQLYLDCGTGNLIGGQLPCSPFKTWKQIYSIKIPQGDNILGSAACMWGELINDEIMDSKIWPRLASLSEVIWTNKQQDDVAKVGRRLGAHGYRLIQRGINSTPITSQSCQRNTTACLGQQKFE